MKVPNGRAWIFLTLLLVTCTAAKAQSTLGQEASGVMAGDAKALGNTVPPPWTDHLEEDANRLGDGARLSSGLRSGNDARLGLTREGRPLPDIFGTPQVRGTQETLLALAREWSSSGVQGESSAASAGDKITINSVGESKEGLEGTLTDSSGDALGEAAVTVRDPQGTSRKLVTDSQGKFRIAGMKGELEGTVTNASGDALPGAVVTVRDSQGRSGTSVTDSQGNFRIVGLKGENEATALAGRTRAATPEGTASRVRFWSLQALMFGSAVAAAETTHNCIQAGSCTAIPVAFRTRTAMYNAGLPAAAGIAILSYEMKKHGNRWWYLPSMVVVAADGLLTFHSARASQ
jgi:hypothetical protein